MGWGEGCLVLLEALGGSWARAFAQRLGTGPRLPVSAETVSVGEALLLVLCSS